MPAAKFVPYALAGILLLSNSATHAAAYGQNSNESTAAPMSRKVSPIHAGSRQQMFVFHVAAMARGERNGGDQNHRSTQPCRRTQAVAQ